jgi:sulfur-oxidizing protein SoxY
MDRRRFLAAGTGALVALALPLPLRAAGADLEAVFAERFGDRRPTEGGVVLEVSRVVENGNSVAVTVRAAEGGEAPSALHLFMPRNPEPWGGTFHVDPPALPRVSTRVRLSGTQDLTAVAEWPDGRLGATAVSVLVTLGACIDENFERWNG